MFLIKYLLLLFIALPLYASNNLYQAHQSYDQGNYPEAIKSYQLDSNSSAEYHYNLGNFYYRNDQRGQAIFHYKLAQELSPRDGDISFNLNYAREKNQDKIEDTTSSWWDSISLKSLFGPKERFYLLAITSLIFWTITTILLFFKRELLQLSQKIAFVVFLLTLFLTSKDYLSTSRFGVVIDQEAKVFSAIGRDNVVLFTLHQGAEFTISEQLEDNWVQIVLRDGKRGWLKTSQIIIN